MFAVIKTGGKQYVVKEGDLLDVEKLGLEAGRKILFEQVLLIDDGANTLIGTPLLPNAVVKADIVEAFKDDKILVFKKKRRKQFRRTRGHRQPLTKVKIEKIYPDRAAVAPEELAVDAVVAEPKPAAAEKPAPKPKAPAKAAEPKAPAKSKADKKKAKPAANSAPKPKAAKK
jgi:large subunit ribosomal protein L21